MEREPRSVLSRVFQIGAILVGVSLIVFLALYYSLFQKDERNAQYLNGQACDQAIEPLNREREELLRQIDQLDFEISGGNLNMGSVMILYVKPYEMVISESLLILDEHEYDFPCIVCCEENAFPGDENCISVAQAKELVGRGWQFALSLTPESDVKALRDRMTDMGLPSPTAVYFPSADFNSDDENEEKKLRALGIKTVLQYDFVPDKEETDVLSYITAYGFREQNCRSVLSSTVATSDAIAFTIGLENYYERYHETPFTSMTRLFHNYVETEEMVVTTTDVAVSRRVAFLAEVEKKERELADDKAALERRVQEVNDEITRVYHEYISD